MEQPRKKSNKLKILYGVLALLILVGVGIGVGFAILKKDEPNTKTELNYNNKVIFLKNLILRIKKSKDKIFYDYFPSPFNFDTDIINKDKEELIYEFLDDVKGHIKRIEKWEKLSETEQLKIGKDNEITNEGVILNNYFQNSEGVILNNYFRDSVKIKYWRYEYTEEGRSIRIIIPLPERKKLLKKLKKSLAKGKQKTISLLNKTKLAIKTIKQLDKLEVKILKNNE